MAIIQCPNCGNNISDKASICPKCGYSIDEQQVVVKQEGLEGYMWAVLLLTGWIVSLIYYLVQKDKAPMKAKQALTCMYINLAVWLVFYFLDALLYY